MKWKSLTIYHLKTVYRNLKLSQVLDDVIDTRFTPIEEISVVQLRAECLERGLSDKGLKVNYKLLTFINIKQRKRKWEHKVW